MESLTVVITPFNDLKETHQETSDLESVLNKMLDFKVSYIYLRQTEGSREISLFYDSKSGSLKQDPRRSKCNTRYWLTQF